jgi:hypothetical protein
LASTDKHRKFPEALVFRRARRETVGISLPSLVA